MKNIYRIAVKKGVEIYPYQRKRIDNMQYSLSDKILNGLSSEQFKKYIEACWCCGSENAGGYDGWVKGHRLLGEIGFVEKERRSGHRVFVSMVYQPRTLTEDKEER